MSEIYIGLMSGTSMDGIDAALVDFTDDCVTMLASHSRKYTPELQQQLDNALQLQDPRAADLTETDKLVGEEFAAAAIELLEKTEVTADQVVAIGSHGQTIRHAPDAAEPYSLQLGSAAAICATTGIDTVADFRRADIAAGGQGAPLAPAFHAAVFTNDSEHRVVVNIGGISNITVLPAGGNGPVTGFDAGPGNTLMDIWIRRHHGRSFDEDGAWAAGGRPDARLLAAMLRDAYFHTPPPKSTGREYFNRAWLSSYLQGLSTKARDVQATLGKLTAVVITDAIEQYAPATQRVLVCGGGVHNAFLMRCLSENLPDLPVESTRALGVDPDWVEATAFAWLAKQHLQGKPGNIPEVTGACEAVVLGKLFRHSQ
ncbi:MAG: anhydro-N-acetylmuramic acid kinase [Gammaproteobacteria bacterium]